MESSANPFANGNGLRPGEFVDPLGSLVRSPGNTQSGGSVPDTAFSYLPFGEVAGRYPPGEDVARSRWAGMEPDAGTGLYYARHRYYHPDLGRFISEDPLGLAGGDANLYAYCGNDPVNFNDPLGLWSVRIGPHDHPWLVFGDDPELRPASVPVRPMKRSYDCDADGMDSMRGSACLRPGMYPGTARSNWARARTSELRDQVVMAAATLSTAGFGILRAGAATTDVVAGRGLRVSIPLSEAKKLVGQWAHDPQQGTRAASLRYHFGKHGAEMGAESVWRYMRQAEGFAQNLRGASKVLLEDGKVRHIKDGKYIIMNSANEIISFGRTHR